MAKKRDDYKINRKTIEVIDSPEIPSLRDAGGKRMSSRGVEVSDREMRGIEKEERALATGTRPMGGGVLGNGLGADSDMVFKVADRKRFSNLVRVIGESEADWVDEALERHGIVIPGGVRLTRMAAATEAMYHAAVADKNVGAYVALRDSGWGKPKEEVEVSSKVEDAIPIRAEVLADMRRARDVGRVVEVVDVGSGDVVIEKDEKGKYGVSGLPRDVEEKK